MADQIIIIGAGATGLLAASLLLKNGADVIVLEARNRTGGRIHTLDSFSQPVEAGAEFVHGNLAITKRLIKEAGTKSEKVKGKFYELRNGEYAKANYFNKEIDEASTMLQKLSHDMPFADFVSKFLESSKYNDFREHLMRMVEGYDGADPKLISTFALRDEWAAWDDQEDLRIEGGYRKIIDYLEQQVKEKNGRIILNCTAQQVNWRKGEVTVTTNQGIFEGEKILITVPLSVLQSESIRFEPRIETHMQACKKIGFGNVIKFLFEFKGDIEKLEGFQKIKDFGFIFTDAPIPTWWSQLPKTNTLFTGWLGGPKAVSFTRDQTEQYDIAVKTLAYILNTTTEEIESMLHKWSIQDWVADPLCRGAYAYATPETDEARKIINTPVEDTVFFAGEAFSQGESMGTVEAAFESAEETVMEISKHLQFTT